MKLIFTFFQKKLKTLENLRVVFYSSEARHKKQVKAQKNYNFKKALKNELKGEILYGIHPVENALKANRRTIHKLYISENICESKSERIAAILEEAERSAVDVVVMKKHILNLLSEDRPHQGLCMDVSALKVPKFEKLGALEPLDRRLVLLDCVQDPMNMGSIIRSSYYFGFSKIFINNKNNCRLTATVSKASSGSMEVAHVKSVACLKSFVEELKEQDWNVIGLSVSQNHNSIKLKDAEKYRDKKVAVVLGNEGTGIEESILQKCSNHLHIPPSFHHHPSLSSPLPSSSPSLSLPPPSSSSPYLDSLNVNVVAGIVFHAFSIPPT